MALMNTMQVGAKPVHVLSTVILQLKRLVGMTTGLQHIVNPSVLAAHALRDKSGAVLNPHRTILDGASMVHAPCNAIPRQNTRVGMRAGLQ